MIDMCCLMQTLTPYCYCPINFWRSYGTWWQCNSTIRFKVIVKLNSKGVLFVRRNKEKQIDNGFCCWWGGVRLILSICGIVNQRAYQTHVFHVLHILVYDFNGRVEKQTDTSRHTPHDTASQIQINFVRGCKSFLKFSFLISVVSWGVQYRSDGRSVSRAKFVRKGHIDMYV